ncbi:MAG: succinate dehydrogenase cytochrome b subunit [Flavobacteriaceae bacterium]|nr:succinate dehydrogenase cytochrome b subunit [Flavobacteriaceae bacterium]
MWFTRNAITRKNLMALTGLFLSFFLIIHLIGNLQLLLPADQAQTAYNTYSHFLSDFLLVKIIAYLLYASILIHSLDAIYLFFLMKKSKGKRYVYDKRGRASKWYTRNMTALGVIILLFLIIHFKDFWYPYKFMEIPIDGEGYRDLYSIVITAFKQEWYILLYLIAFIALGYHLIHGVFSAHRSLGLYNKTYSLIIKNLSLIFAIIITLGYSIIPIFIYLYR